MNIEQDLISVRNVFINYPKQHESAIKELSKVDCEIQDLLHVVEFGKLDAIKISKVMRDLKFAQQKRRMLKNEIELLETVRRIPKINIREHELNKIIGQVRKVIENQSRRKYTMRIRRDFQRLVDPN